MQKCVKLFCHFGFQARIDTFYHYRLAVPDPEKSRANWTGVPALIRHQLNYTTFRYLNQGFDVHSL